MRLRALIVAVGLLWPVSVFSETTQIIGGSFFATGNDVFSFCSDSPAAAQFYCLGYMVGVADAFASVRVLGVSKPFCIPNNVTREQVRDVVMQYLTAHPESRHYDGAGEALWALEAAFPCQ